MYLWYLVCISFINVIRNLYTFLFIYLFIPSLDVYHPSTGSSVVNSHSHSHSHSFSLSLSLPSPNVPSPNFFQTEKMAQNQCFHRNRVVKKNWQWGLGQHGPRHLPDIFSIDPRSFREGHTYSFF